MPKAETGYIQSLRITVYDVLGKEIKTLVDEKQSPGNYEITFDTFGLPSGMYFYKLESGQYNIVRKMMLLK